jgi:hypothetical protein
MCTTRGGRVPVPSCLLFLCSARAPSALLPCQARHMRPPVSFVLCRRQFHHHLQSVTGSSRPCMPRPCRLAHRVRSSLAAPARIPRARKLLARPALPLCAPGTQLPMWGVRACDLVMRSIRTVMPLVVLKRCVVGRRVRLAYPWDEWVYQMRHQFRNAGVLRTICAVW